MKRIAVIGAGRVGLVTAACLAHLGNWVTCIERNPVYLEILRAGRIPFFEPQLQELVGDCVARELLTFSDTIADGTAGAGIVFLAVGTPQTENGASLDLSDVMDAVREIARNVRTDTCIVSKSTVPAGTNNQLASIVESELRFPCRVSVVSNPEFLREGSAVADFLQPDRIIIGVHRRPDAKILEELYSQLNAPIVVTDIRAAELIKAVSNFYLALRVSFANEVADLCDILKIDVLEVLRAVGMDARIGCAYLQPGLGFGGPCLPKDLRGLADTAFRADVETPLMTAALRVNERRIEKAAAILSDSLNGLQDRCICVLGLSFKPGTDDIRDAPSLRFIERIVSEGATVRAHDPIALENFRRSAVASRVLCSGKIEHAVRGADAIAVMTSWPQYKEVSLAALRAAMRGDVLFDAANLFEPVEVARAGLRYRGMGRPAIPVLHTVPSAPEHVSA